MKLLILVLFLFLCGCLHAENGGHAREVGGLLSGVKGSTYEETVQRVDIFEITPVFKECLDIKGFFRFFPLKEGYEKESFIYYSDDKGGKQLITGNPKELLSILLDQGVDLSRQKDQCIVNEIVELLKPRHLIYEILDDEDKFNSYVDDRVAVEYPFFEGEKSLINGGGYVYHILALRGRDLVRLEVILSREYISIAESVIKRNVAVRYDLH